MNYKFYDAQLSAQTFDVKVIRFDQHVFHSGFIMQ